MLLDQHAPRRPVSLAIRRTIGSRSSTITGASPMLISSRAGRGAAGPGAPDREHLLLTAGQRPRLHRPAACRAPGTAEHVRDGRPAATAARAQVLPAGEGGEQRPVVGDEHQPEPADRAAGRPLSPACRIDETRPPSRGSSPARVSSSVVFPAPFGPRTARISPADTSRSKPRSTGRPIARRQALHSSTVFTAPPAACGGLAPAAGQARVGCRARPSRASCPGRRRRPAVRPDLVGRSRRDDRTRIQHVHLIAQAEHQVHVVVHQHDASPRPARTSRSRSASQSLSAAVQAGRRLVEQQQRRPAGQGPGDGDELALPLGQLGDRPVRCSAPRPSMVQRPVRFPAAAGGESGRRPATFSSTERSSYSSMPWKVRPRPADPLVRAQPVELPATADSPVIAGEPADRVDQRVSSPHRSGRSAR